MVWIDLELKWKATFRAATGLPPPPQYHLQGLRGGDGIEEGVGKILKTKRQGFLRTGAESSSRRGAKTGTEPRSGGRDQGWALGDLLCLRKDWADLGRNSPKGFKPGSWTKGGGRGPPRRGGCWGQRTGPRTGLSQSMETVSCLEPISREKNLSLRLRTLLRERLYGGVLAHKHILSGG